MYTLGRKKDLIAKELLNPLFDGWPQPSTYYPDLPAGHKVVCEYCKSTVDDNLAEMLVCETKDEMHKLYEDFKNDIAFVIRWYSAPIMGTIKPIEVVD